ncbi:MAG: 16S rRNA (cytidine(1402)-2'-O)-methyltransferase [Clostridia bacterium]|nr:16S rRNA (cytidine(1402)-2'-O)-methyltransferase [Clostridia bacterium]
MSGILYVVGTPIGNLGDFSPRAVETLEKCDFIAAEDTRVTLKLLNRFGINTPMISYHEHNRFQKGEEIVNRIIAGESCAIVTDAGMPAISDPGEDLVALCHERGVKVQAVPGPSAFVSALAVSGMSVGRFTFEGFLSVNKKSRREHLDSLVNETRTMVFYEAPHKVSQTLKDMYAVFGNREITIVREITKIYEEVIRTCLEDAVRDYGNDELKGELVLIIAGAEIQKEEFTTEQAVELAREILFSGKSAADAAKTAAKKTGVKKGDIYRLLVSEE